MTFEASENECADGNGEKAGEDVDKISGSQKKDTELLKLFDQKSNRDQP